MKVLLTLLFLALTTTACTSSRVLRLENKVLTTENKRLEAETDRLRQTQLDPIHFTKEVTIESLSKVLERTGYQHDLVKGNSHITMEYRGQNAQFNVNIQHYEKAQVVFIATSNYYALDQAQNTQSVILLAVQLMALNYELLLGKFQMNPESGEILLSTELYVGDGLGHATLLQALDHLCRTADEKHPELVRAASGVGL